MPDLSFNPFADFFNNTGDPNSPENQKALQDVLNQYDKDGEEAKKVGMEVVNDILAGGGADLSALTEKIDNILDDLKELFDEEPDIKPVDFKTRVVRGDDALAALEDFRAEKLKEFYQDKFSDIKETCQDLFSGDTFQGWAQQAKKMQFTTLFSGVLDACAEILEVALDVKDILDLVTDKEKELAGFQDDPGKMLQQGNEEKSVDGKHRTRRA